MTFKTQLLLENYDKICIRLADEFLMKYFNYTNPNSLESFVDYIGGTLDCGAIYFFSMEDIIQIFKIDPLKKYPILYCEAMVETKCADDWPSFKQWYSQTQEIIINQ